MSEGWFHRFCSALDTPGGHILIGFGVLIIGGVFAKLDVPHGPELITVGSTIVGFAAKGHNGKGAGVVPVAATVTATGTNEKK